MNAKNISEVSRKRQNHETQIPEAPKEGGMRNKNDKTNATYESIHVQKRTATE